MRIVVAARALDLVPCGAAGAEQRLVATVIGVAGALVDAQLGVGARSIGGLVEVGPEAAGADGLVLGRVADRDQPGG
jgi:hypothetical protein